MIFELFHSLGRVDTVRPARSDQEIYTDFFAQVRAAEELGFATIWAAESHFSSEVQKRGPEPVIPHYRGEVGLNNDPMQLAHAVCHQTKSIGFGTAILNIVGGNGGPIAAADRVRSLAWLNQLREEPRRLHIGVAAGRFPYINRPFGIVPRDDRERELWPQYKQLIFVEALEIFLRLSLGEVIGSEDTIEHEIDGVPYRKRWVFDRLQLVPQMTATEVDEHIRFVLGSADPRAREVGLKFADLDIFNLSFTPPDKINAIHREMTERYQDHGRVWARWRLPRTVLVFVDKDRRRAHERADHAFDTYIEAMRGTAKFPPKEFLKARALIGEPEEIRAAMAPGGSHGFEPDDRLMLWFEFNQSDGEQILYQMRLFSEYVMPHFAGERS